MSRRARREAIVEDIRQRYARIAAAPWFKAAYEGKSLGEILRVDCGCRGPHHESAVPNEDHSEGGEK